MADRTMQVERLASEQGLLPFNSHDVRMALIVTRREVRDSFRDWRIIIPIILLTLFFPLLMNYTANRLLQFVTDYGAELIGTRLIPFLLLVVGFFPTSFSLVIALETFVGEKERKSLEPLLATPLTNKQLYLGKMLAALVPPLTASYLGITVYLIGLALTVAWYPSLQLFVQTILITTVQGVVMVAGAVVVSSQTTSTRAANLLASFIIVPMALLVQVEAVVMFWGNYAGLWWLVAGLSVSAIVLMRMGVAVFNREELLGRDIDQIRIGWMWRVFWARFSGREESGRYPSLWRWYRQTLALVPHLREALLMTFIGFAGAVLLGVLLAQQYTFPATVQSALQQADQLENLARLEGVLTGLPATIFVHNVRVILLAIILGVFTFGVLGLAIFLLPWAVIGFIAMQLVYAGENAVLFVLATIAPHATIELPALLLVAAAALRWQTAVIAPQPDQTVSQSWLEAGADFARILVGIIAPLLLLAAVVEAYVTPLVVRAVYAA
ncbi:MAG TPA: stage II sporulation protein M [Candidatus Sulfomarinibacteraceae bacterium]|nr:stage II sporulation protein M [Candidatus Sulfomarinibacteraceae bacterium]